MSDQFKEILESYERFVARTSAVPGDLITAALELSAETGELVGPVVKTRRGNRQAILDRNDFGQERTIDLIDELGDVLWCVQNMADALGTSLTDLMICNYAKLTRRRGEPDSFLLDE